MYLWFLANPERLNSERRAIEELEQSADWLVGTDWSLSNGLGLDAVIRVYGNDYQVRMTYPQLFPSVPPTVWPLNAQELWTIHQYGGSDGPLCLEWGPDNWRPDITGAHMLESAYNLLQAETEHPETRAPVPSRHQLTTGQELRFALVRCYLGEELNGLLQSLPLQVSGLFEFSLKSRKKGWLAIVHEATPSGEPGTRRECSIPSFMRGPGGNDALLHDGVFFKTDIVPEVLAGVNRVQELEDILHAAGFQIDVFAPDVSNDRSRMGLNAPPSGLLIFDGTGNPHFFFVLDDGGLFKFTVFRSRPSARALRTPADHTELANKSVGIVGVGSVGSKIALTLARMGLGKIFLIDHDVFLPENIERHILDWNHIGEHKVDAMGEVISQVRADVEVKISRTHLTGQESSAVVSGGLNRLSQCELIVDATADARVFNLLAAVATNTQTPLLWMEVYAGGRGGMIARSRPGKDPNPYTMRAVYNQFFVERPAPELQITNDYTAEDAEGRVLTASDSDVAIIAHNAARLAVDTALGRDPSAYPYSMYLIGLEQWWVFTAPFDTIPIATDGFTTHETTSQVPTEDTSGFIIELLRKAVDAASTSS